MVVLMKNLHDESVLVSTTTVTWCADRGQSVIINFEKGNQIEVKGPLAQVQRDLNSSR
jgi:hypothetical protein